MNVIDPIVALRIICGVFFLPHIAAKIYARPVTLGFFQAAGYRPAAFFMYLALVVETIVSFSLIAGLFLPYVAWVAALFMLVAAFAGMVVGQKVRGLASPKTFRLCFFIGLLALGAHLALHGLL